MATKHVSPRLFVIFAKEADEAVIFARGPSEWFHLIQWDTRRDKFESGAWIKGRIYPDRCDLSPDGRLLVYFVHQGRRTGTSYTNAWTGVSRSPWLTALALWPWGSTWSGGGHFENNNKVVLGSGCEVAPHPDHLPVGLEVAWGSARQHVSTNEVPGAEWSGRDQRGRLIFARNGRVHWMKESGAVQILVDFNGNKPEPKEAPDWARKLRRNSLGRYVI